MNNINLEIYTPYGKYCAIKVDEIQIHSDDFYLGILPNHTPLISSVIISKLTLKIKDIYHYYAIGGGVVDVKKDKTVLILKSIESKDEIDISRAIESKKRAENRLNSSDGDIDIKRAQISLMRALNRINVFNEK